MHELSVCQSMLRQVSEIARQHDACQVSRVRLRIGVLSGVEPDLLQQAFPIASSGTVAEGAQLLINTLPVCVRCESCGAESEVAANKLICAACGDWHTRLISGNELLLDSVEIETERGQAHV
jgi:hydrogenase nickel incorporation protein HypA/HybF